MLSRTRLSNILDRMTKALKDIPPFNKSVRGDKFSEHSSNTSFATPGHDLVPEPRAKSMSEAIPAFPAHQEPQQSTIPGPTWQDQDVIFHSPTAEARQSTRGTVSLTYNSEINGRQLRVPVRLSPKRPTQHTSPRTPETGHDLFHSPTSKGTPSAPQQISETYTNETHGRELRRPILLTGIYCQRANTEKRTTLQHYQSVRDCP